ncbi:MAG TPA: hypothetical protein VGI39_27275, partial [Polyangiaceae bacterium]
MQRTSFEKIISLLTLASFLAGLTPRAAWAQEEPRPRDEAPVREESALDAPKGKLAKAPQGEASDPDAPDLTFKRHEDPSAHPSPAPESPRPESVQPQSLPTGVDKTG